MIYNISIGEIFMDFLKQLLKQADLIKYTWEGYDYEIWQFDNICETDIETEVELIYHLGAWTNYYNLENGVFLYKLEDEDYILIGKIIKENGNVKVISKR